MKFLWQVLCSSRVRVEWPVQFSVEYFRNISAKPPPRHHHQEAALEVFQAISSLIRRLSELKPETEGSKVKVGTGARGRTGTMLPDFMNPFTW